MLLPTRIAKLDVQNGSTYAALDTVKIKLNQLGALSSQGLNGKTTNLVALTLAFAFVVNNAGGGTIVLEHEKVHDVIRRTQLKAAGHDFFVMPQRGGFALAELYRTTYGKPTIFRTDTSITAAGNGTVRPVFVFPFMDPRAERPEDHQVPARIFKDSELEMDYASGAAASDLFGANVSITSGSIVEAHVILQDVDNFTVPVRRVVFQRVLKNINGDTETLPAGYKWTDIVLFPHHSPAGGIATSPYTTATITKIEAQLDNEAVVKNLTPGSLTLARTIARANSLETTAEDPIYETAGDNFRIPIVTARKGYRTTEGGICTAVPRLDISGTITPSQHSLLAIGLMPTTPKTAMDWYVAAGFEPSPEHAANPAQFWKERTAQKQVSVAMHKRVWLPQTYLPGGRRGDRHRAAA